MLSGTASLQEPRPGPVARQSPALRVRGLRKAFATPAVDDLDLTVRAGELYALLGPNGAGKTTTLRMIAGLLPPDAGSIEIFGIDALRRSRSPPSGSRRGCPTSPCSTTSSRRSSIWNSSPACGASSALAPSATPRSCCEVLELAPHAHARCEGFSRGMKQKVALAGALIHDPSLIMLDEPLTGLDAGIARQVKDLLGARVRAGAAIILTTHILEVAERLADRIGIVAHGRLVAEGTLAELKSMTGRGSSSLEDVFLAVTGKDAQAA